MDAFDECLHCAKHGSTFCEHGGRELTPLFKKELAIQLQGRQLPGSIQLLALRFQLSFQPRPCSSSSAQVLDFCTTQSSIHGQPLFWSSLLSWLRLYQTNIRNRWTLCLSHLASSPLLEALKYTFDWQDLHVCTDFLFERFLFSCCEVYFFIKDLWSFWVFPPAPSDSKFQPDLLVLCIFIVLVKENI